MVKRLAGLLILAALAPYLVRAVTTSVTEYHIPCSCPTNYAPVCGSDGITYSNKCALRCVSEDQKRNNRASIRQWYLGVCRPLYCKCPKILQPVCGMNNQTYVNHCYLACDNFFRTKASLPSIGIKNEGSCKQKICRCPSSIIPVCGTDGKTYQNICLLQCYSRMNQAQRLPTVYTLKPGACLNEAYKTCSTVESLLCASDGRTYYNQSALDRENRRRIQLGLDPITIQYPGECISCACPANYDPVCASDGKTYSNNCALVCENKKRKRAGLPELTKRWNGPCDCGCTHESEPVCASDRRTYLNRCMLNCENRKRALCGLSPLTVVHKGLCRQCNCNQCYLYGYRPVCGSNRKFYWNSCFLRCNSACNISYGLPLIVPINDIECLKVINCA